MYQPRKLVPQKLAHTKILVAKSLTLVSHFSTLVLAEGFKLLKFSEDLREVSEKIKHALLSSFPRRRYTTGKKANILVFISHLPTLISDYLMDKLLPNLKPRRS